MKPLILLALKGLNRLAQGNALGTRQNHQALKGRNTKLDVILYLYIAPSGLILLTMLNPRALPWALVLHPFGAIIANTVRLGMSVFSFLSLTRMPASGGQ